MTGHAPLLTDVQRAVLADERSLLTDLRVALARLGADDHAQATLALSLRQLDELFLLVVVGEFNAGKSAFVNALIGEDVLPEGVTPTTARITVVRHGAATATQVTPDGVAGVTAPVDFLREVHVVDTPGTNAVLREHETGDHRVRAPRRPRALDHLGRPAVQRERAAVPRTGARLGQEDRLRRQQDRHPGRPRAGRRGGRVRRGQRQGAPRGLADGLSRQRPRRETGARRRRLLGRERHGSRGPVHLEHAGRLRTGAAEVEEPARRRAARVRDPAQRPRGAAVAAARRHAVGRANRTPARRVQPRT